MPQQNETTGAFDDRKLQEAEALEREVQAALTLRDRGSLFTEGDKPAPSTFAGATEDTLRNRAVLAGEVSSQPLRPGDDPSTNAFLVTAGKIFTDTFRNAEVLAQQIMSQGPPGPGRIATAPSTEEQIIKLDKEAADSQALFDILAQRKPSVRQFDFWTKLAVAFGIPASRATATARQVERGVDAVSTVATGRRAASLGSEATAGASISLMQNQQSEDLAFNTVLGTAIGAGVYKMMTGFNSGGQMMIGGRPATLQRIDDLKAAEESLNVTGLLTTAELRGGGIMNRIEGVYDNLPIPMLGLAGRREAQAEGFQNAVKQIQMAFPDMADDQVTAILRTQLGKNEKIVKGLYKEVAAEAQGLPGFVTVQPTHYVRQAEKMLVEELNKGAAASNAVIKELEQVITQGPVDFMTATRVAGDLGTKIRKAERAATDPAATGLDAGRQKQLSLSWFRDLETWTKQFPENSAIVKKWQASKDAYKELVLPFNKRPLAPLFDEHGFDSYALSKTIMNPSAGEKLTKLDKDGAMAWLFVNNAIEESTKGGIVNVKMLSSILDRTKSRRALAAVSENIPKESQQMIRALTKIVNAAPGQFVSKRNVLKTVSASTAAGGIVGGAGFISDNPALGAGQAIVTLGLLRWGLGSASGRAFLTSASRIPAKNRDALAAVGSRMNLAYQRYVETAVITETPAAIQGVIDDPAGTVKGLGRTLQ